MSSKRREREPDLFNKVKELGIWNVCVHSDKHVGVMTPSCCEDIHSHCLPQPMIELP